MPKYFANKGEQLFSEACATFLLLDSMEGQTHKEKVRLQRLTDKAQARSARRWNKAQGPKC